MRGAREDTEDYWPTEIVPAITSSQLGGFENTHLFRLGNVGLWRLSAEPDATLLALLVQDFTARLPLRVHHAD